VLGLESPSYIGGTGGGDRRADAHATPPWVTETLWIISAAGRQNAGNACGLQWSRGIRARRRNLPTMP